jgi:MFS family permease
MCLSLLALACVGLALVPTNAYWLLMVLRVVQSAGSASTIALGAGVVSDIAAPEERGGYIGLAIAGGMASSST